MPQTWAKSAMQEEWGKTGSAKAHGFPSRNEGVSNQMTEINYTRAGSRALPSVNVVLSVLEQRYNVDFYTYTMEVNFAFVVSIPS